MGTKNIYKQEAKRGAGKTAVLIFLNAKSIKYSVSDVLLPPQDGPVDVHVPGLGLKFQVISVDGDTIRIRTEDKYSYGTTKENAVQKYIVNPITKKIKYDPVSVHDVVLLIHTLGLPPDGWLTPINSEIKDSIRLLCLNSGFSDIYFVQEGDYKIIHLYQRSNQELLWC